MKNCHLYLIIRKRLAKSIFLINYQIFFYESVKKLVNLLYVLRGGKLFVITNKCFKKNENISLFFFIQCFVFHLYHHKSAVYFKILNISEMLIFLCNIFFSSSPGFYRLFSKKYSHFSSTRTWIYLFFCLQKKKKMKTVILVCKWNKIFFSRLLFKKTYFQNIHVQIQSINFVFFLRKVSSSHKRYIQDNFCT